MSFIIDNVKGFLRFMIEHKKWVAIWILLSPVVYYILLGVYGIFGLLFGFSTSVGAELCAFIDIIVGVCLGLCLLVEELD